ncbi:hypothetical protein ABZ464_48520 [Streptomyces sp. NPDC005820]|uniref:Kelch repeat-containing protein n=1 Tax=Streptomyces sp. NPDC005820 TaxID=3157069 RepID=UPI0033CA0ECD
MPPIRTAPRRWRARCALTGVLAAVALLCGTLPADARTGLNWITLPSLPKARADLAAAAAPCPRGQSGSCLYAVGGWDSGVLATAQAYNQRTNAWSTLPDLPTPRYGLAAAAAPCPDGQSGTCVYALGGYGASGRVATVQSYDPATGGWTTVTSLGTARAYPGAAAAPCPAGQTGTCLYAVGGDDGSGVTARVESFNPVTRTWTTLSALHTARNGVSAATAICPAGQTGTCVYAVGGLDSTGHVTGAVESYNPVTRAWTTLAALPVPLATPVVAATTCPPGQQGTCVYAATGIGAGGARSDAQSYNPLSRVWTTLPSAPTARQEAAGAALPCPPGTTGNCVFVVGGFASSGVVATVQALDPPVTGGR